MAGDERRLLFLTCVLLSQFSGITKRSIGRELLQYTVARVLPGVPWGAVARGCGMGKKNLQGFSHRRQKKLRVRSFGFVLLLLLFFWVDNEK